LAITGTVASAVRFLAKAILCGVRDEKFFTPEEWEQAVAYIATDKGIGRKLIVRFLAGIPAHKLDTQPYQRLMKRAVNGTFF
jgi:hypothetical protein